MPGHLLKKIDMAKEKDDFAQLAMNGQLQIVDVGKTFDNSKHVTTISSIDPVEHIETEIHLKIFSKTNTGGKDAAGIIVDAFTQLAEIGLTPSEMRNKIESLTAEMKRKKSN